MPVFLYMLYDTNLHIISTTKKFNKFAEIFQCDFQSIIALVVFKTYICFLQKIGVI